MKKQIWMDASGSYYGSTGYDTVREVAEAMLADPHFVDVFDGFDEPTTLDSAEAYLISEGIAADHVPVSAFHMEQWPDSVRHNMPMDAKPGRGYIRVLGVNL